MTARAAAWLGRAVLVVAATLLVAAIALAALGITITTWPYRRLLGPSQRRVQVEAALAWLTATAALLSVLRGTTREDGGEG